MTHFQLIFDFRIYFTYLYIWDCNRPSDHNTTDAMIEALFTYAHMHISSNTCQNKSKDLIHPSP